MRAEDENHLVEAFVSNPAGFRCGRSDMRRLDHLTVRAELRPSRAEDEVARLFARHSERLLSYCLGWSHSRSDAEDAVQTTFLYALRALQRGVAPGSEPAWLTAIAKNVCRAQVRASIRNRSALDALERGELASIDRELEKHELCRALKVALAEIPETQRRALVLKQWGGLSSAEVAAQLGISTPAAYALLTRARRSVVRALTSLPRQAALAFTAFVCELRAAIKAVLGVGAAKTVAATAVVTALAAGGVSADFVPGEETGPVPTSVESFRGAMGSGGEKVATASRSRHRPVGRGHVGFLRARPAERVQADTAQPSLLEAPIAGDRAPVGVGSPFQELLGGSSFAILEATVPGAEELLADPVSELPLPEVSLLEEELLDLEAPIVEEALAIDVLPVEAPAVEDPSLLSVGEVGDPAPASGLGLEDLLPDSSTP